jgi:hypothetical protein
MSRKNQKLPDHVEEVRKIIARNIPVTRTPNKLLSTDPEIIKMWRSIERKEKVFNDTSWVLWFLHFAREASNLADYELLSKSDREDNLHKITNSIKNLSQAIRVTGLDAYVHLDENTAETGCLRETKKKVDLYEDPDSQSPKKTDLTVLQLLDQLSNWASIELQKEPKPGKAGKTVTQIKFIHTMAGYLETFYDTPLLSVLATACNSIYGTNFNKSDISKILKRNK